MKFINNKSRSKLTRNGLIPNIYSFGFKIRSPLLISFDKHLKC